jgi:4-hydroxybenzoate polyprenyltransferase
VFVGLVFGHQWNHGTLVQVGLAFASFCAMASAVYILNDATDAAADRLHPKKRFRPIASGAVSVQAGYALGVVLVTVACVLSWLAAPAVLTIVLAYALMNVAYSIRLKRIVIIDVFVIASGFMLRILAGTVGVGIQPSSWLLLCGMMVTLFLGFSKRRAELIGYRPAEPRGGSRRVLDAYNPMVVDQFQSIAATGTILTYALYTVSPETVALHGSNHLIYTVPLIVYGIYRYMYLLHATGSGEDTARDLLRDRHLLLTAMAWVVATLSVVL